MKFSELYYLIESEAIEHVPTKDELRHFHQVRRGNKIDYSKDFHNKVLKNFYSITLGINDEKLRKSFAEIIFRNMGNLDDLIEIVKRKTEMNPNNNKYKELSRYISKIEGD
jgi:hypothetical protein